jgi:hypothetical protein
MESTIFQSPMRWPSREPSSTCGLALMFSWPPATTISLSPQATAWAASITAFRPEPQTALMVSAGFPWQAGLDDGLAGRVLARTGGQHLAHDDFADLVRAEHWRGPAPLDDDAAQFRGRNLGQRATKLAHGGAGG